MSIRIAALSLAICTALCGQQRQATYRFTFQSTWSAQTHPTSFPTNPRFTPFVGGLHDPGVSFWGVGQLASFGLEQLAMTGNTFPFFQQVGQTVIFGTPSVALSYTNALVPSPGSVSYEFTTTRAMLTMVALFGDADGAVFNTRGEESDLIVRVKTGYDGSVPTANSVALRNCVALFELTGVDRFRAQADELAGAFTPTLSSNPMALMEMLLGVDSLLGERVELVLAGDDAGVRALLLEARSGFHPNLFIARAPSGSEGERAESIQPALQGKTAGGGATAYVCRGFSCLQPTSDASAMRGQLDLLAAES